VRMAAAMQGSAEFLAPETRMVPTSGLPPRMTNLSMKSGNLYSSQFKLSMLTLLRFSDGDGSGSAALLQLRACLEGPPGLWAQIPLLHQLGQGECRQIPLPIEVIRIFLSSKELG
jgi:hypothetical protein